MHDAAVVDRRQPVGDRRRDPQRLGLVEGMSVGRQLGDRPTGDEVHHQGRLVRIDHGVAHRDHVRVADGLHGRRFAPESLARALVRDQVRMEALDRDDLARALIVGAPDRRHAAHGVCFEQAVATPQQTSVHPCACTTGGTPTG